MQSDDENRIQFRKNLEFRMLKFEIEMVFWFPMPVWCVLFYLGWTEAERFVEGVTLGAWVMTLLLDKYQRKLKVVDKGGW